MKRALFIGRYQPLTESHVKELRTAMAKGNKLCVAVRDTEVDELNPHTMVERLDMFDKRFGLEISTGAMMVMPIPDVGNIITVQEG